MADPRPPAAPESPTELDPRYESRGVLGVGGASVVSRVHDRVLHRDVAMKVTSLQHPDELARFHREARITAMLDHPNIVPIHDLGERWFTMKRVEGVTFGQMVRGEPDTLQMLGKALDVLLRVCDAMSFANHRGVVHRDLKPENVMVGPFGEVYVVDWGIAQVADDTETRFAGTVGWVSPEQAREERADARTDVWGVGALLYYCLCGRKPNRNLTLDQRAATGADARPVEPPKNSAGRPTPPPELERIAMKALSLDPADRYPDCQALAADLRRAQAEGWWFESQTYPAGSVIVKQGDHANTAYLIVEGSCEVSQNGGPIAELGAGQTFGESALVSGGARTATVTAETDVVVRVLTREALLSEVKRGGWMGSLILELASRFHELSLDSMVRKPASS